MVITVNTITATIINDDSSFELMLTFKRVPNTKITWPWYLDEYGHHCQHHHHHHYHWFWLSKEFLPPRLISLDEYGHHCQHHYCHHHHSCWFWLSKDFLPLRWLDFDVFITSMKTIVLTTATTVNTIHLDVYFQCTVNYNWDILIWWSNNNYHLFFLQDRPEWRRHIMAWFDEVGDLRDFYLYFVWWSH